MKKRLSPIINQKRQPKDDFSMTNKVNNRLFWRDDEPLIDKEQQTHDFQNDEDIDHMQVEVVCMVD